MYYVTLRRISITPATMEKQSVLQILMCVCSLSYPACEVHVPYYTVHWPVWPLLYFFSLSHKWHGFREKAMEH